MLGSENRNHPRLCVARWPSSDAKTSGGIIFYIYKNLHSLKRENIGRNRISHIPQVRATITCVACSPPAETSTKTPRVEPQEPNPTSTNARHCQASPSPGPNCCRVGRAKRKLFGSGLQSLVCVRETVCCTRLGFLKLYFDMIYHTILSYSAKSYPINAGTFNLAENLRRSPKTRETPRIAAQRQQRDQLRKGEWETSISLKRRSRNPKPQYRSLSALMGRLHCE